TQRAQRSRENQSCRSQRSITPGKESVRILAFFALFAPLRFVALQEEKTNGYIGRNRVSGPDGAADYTSRAGGRVGGVPDRLAACGAREPGGGVLPRWQGPRRVRADRKSTRLNSS